MSQRDDPQRRSDGDNFAQQAESKQAGLFGELFAFLRDTRKWFLAPIILLLLIVGLIVVLGGSAAAPFIYTLF